MKMKRVRRTVPQVDSSSVTDVVFLLLIFFLVINSINVDQGIERRLPPPIGKYQPVRIEGRNLLNVCLTDNDELLCGNHFLGIGELREYAKMFIANERNLPNFPERIMRDIPFLGNVLVTANHVISVQCGRQTTYQAYLDVQNELVGAYNELRDELAHKKWNKTYEKLTLKQQKAICYYYPIRISEAEPVSEGGKK